MTDCLLEVALFFCISNLDNFQYKIFLLITFNLMIFYPQLYTEKGAARFQRPCTKKWLKKSPALPGSEESAGRSGFGGTAHFELGVGNLCFDEFDIS